MLGYIFRLRDAQRRRTCRRISGAFPSAKSPAHTTGTRELSHLAYPAAVTAGIPGRHSKGTRQPPRILHQGKSPRSAYPAVIVRVPGSHPESHTWGTRELLAGAGSRPFPSLGREKQIPKNRNQDPAAHARDTRQPPRPILPPPPWPSPYPRGRGGHAPSGATRVPDAVFLQRRARRWRPASPRTHAPRPSMPPNTAAPLSVLAKPLCPIPL